MRGSVAAGPLAQATCSPGEIKMNSHDLRGFGMLSEHSRVETRRIAALMEKAD